MNGFCSIHLGAISLEILVSIYKKSLKITFLKLLPHLPEANELNCVLEFVSLFQMVQNYGAGLNRWNSAGLSGLDNRKFPGGNKISGAKLP